MFGCPLPTPDGATDAPVLGGGPRRDKHSPFGLPDEETFLKDGEATVQWWKDTIVNLRTEGADARCGAVTLGTVADVFPNFLGALEKAGVDSAQIEGAWVVPPFIVKDLGGRAHWREARGRLAPFLKNDVWRRINAEASQGAAVDWQKMGLMAPNLVVVKQRRAWRELATVARSQVTWAATRRLAREAYVGATRERAWSLLVSAWPLRWSWLIAWLLIDLAVWSSYLATSAVLPISRHDVIMFLLANLMGGAQLMRARAEGDKALADAASFKTAGSVALRKGKLDVAIEQYLEGEKCAAKLADMPSLNRAFAGRGAPLRVACLNNASLVRLKQQEWEAAALLCERTLALDPEEPLARAKALFRLAVGRAKLGDEDAACEALQTAHALVPTDSEIEGMLTVLRWGGERRRARARAAADASEADELDAALTGEVKRARTLRRSTRRCRATPAR